MIKRIIYKNEKGEVDFIRAAARTSLTIEEIAAIDVPVTVEIEKVISKEVAESYMANVGDQVNRRIALLNNVVFTETPYYIVDYATLKDRTFRNAWDINKSAVVTNMVKAKVIAHDKRRKKRDEEMAPYDDIIMRQIPGTNPNQAEASRAQLRSKYAAMQNDLDTATTPEELKTILGI